MNKFLTYSDFINEMKLIKSPLEEILKNKYSSVIKKLSLIEDDLGGMEVNVIILKNQSEGFGTKIFNEIIQYADMNKKILYMEPTDEYGSELPRLVEFYKRFGFVMNKGKDKNSKFPGTMIRPIQKIK